MINPKSEDVADAVEDATQGMGAYVTIVAAGNLKGIENIKGIYPHIANNFSSELRACQDKE